MLLPVQTDDTGKGYPGAVDVAVEEIKGISIPVEGKHDIAQVASISAGEEEIEPYRRCHGKGRHRRRHYRRGTKSWAPHWK